LNRGKCGAPDGEKKKPRGEKGCKTNGGLRRGEPRAINLLEGRNWSRKKRTGGQEGSQKELKKFVERPTSGKIGETVQKKVVWGGRGEGPSTGAYTGMDYLPPGGEKDMQQTEKKRGKEKKWREQLRGGISLIMEGGGGGGKKFCRRQRKGGEEKQGKNSAPAKQRTQKEIWGRKEGHDRRKGGRGHPGKGTSEKATEEK